MIQVFAPSILSEKDEERIIHSIQNRGEEFAPSFSRSRIQVLPLEIGDIVLKEYRRGGFLGKIFHSLHCKTGKNRPEEEFKFLQVVRSLGVHAPEPVFWVIESFLGKGALLYRGFLGSKLVKHRGSIASLSSEDISLVSLGLTSFIKQLEILIKHKIYHLDLHPGNVLLCADGEAVVIDFDKANHFEGSEVKLRERYLRRWRRAVLKHDLPPFLTEVVCSAIRRV